MVQQNEPAVLDFVRELISVTDDMRFLMTMDMFDEVRLWLRSAGGSGEGSTLRHC